jgi:hypothetical protein
MLVGNADARVPITAFLYCIILKFHVQMFFYLNACQCLPVTTCCIIKCMYYALLCSSAL